MQERGVAPALSDGVRHRHDGARRLLVGGAVAAAKRLRNGTPGWVLMPPGSTPRLVLCIAAALLALWLGAVVTSGSGASLRIAVLAVIGMTGVRVIGDRQPDVVLSGVAGLALAAAAASSLASGQVEPAMAFGGALLAATTSFVRWREPQRA